MPERRPIQRNLGREVRINVLNIQLLLGPSQGIESVLKITGLICLPSLAVFLAPMEEKGMNTIETRKRSRPVSQGQKEFCGHHQEELSPDSPSMEASVLSYLAGITAFFCHSIIHSFIHSAKRLPWTCCKPGIVPGKFWRILLPVMVKIFLEINDC